MYSCKGLDKIQQAAGRTFLGVTKFAPFLGIEGDLGWQSTEIRRNKLMLNYWNRLLKKERCHTLQAYIYLGL